MAKKEKGFLSFTRFIRDPVGPQWSGYQSEKELRKIFEGHGIGTVIDIGGKFMVHKGNEILIYQKETGT